MTQIPYPYGDGYLEWVTDHYRWREDDPLTTADTRSLWERHLRLIDDPLIVELNATGAEERPVTPEA